MIISDEIEIKQDANSVREFASCLCLNGLRWIGFSRWMGLFESLSVPLHCYFGVDVWRYSFAVVRVHVFRCG